MGTKIQRAANRETLPLPGKSRGRSRLLLRSDENPATAKNLTVQASTKLLILTPRTGARKLQYHFGPPRSATFSKPSVPVSVQDRM